MDSNGQNMKVVFAVVDRGAGKSYWTRVGVGFVNRDGSITLKLDAIPINGTLQVREWEARDRDDGRRPGDADDHASGSGRPRPRRDEGGAPPRRDISGALV